MKPLRRRVLRAIAAALSGLTGPAALHALGDEVAAVDIQDYKFMPAELKVKRGTAVKWTNREKRTTHSVLFTGARGFESERLFPGDSWQYRFNQTGRHAYTCGPHPEMKGMVEVVD